MNIEQFSRPIANHLENRMIENLFNEYNDAHFLNFTLESGRMGYALLFLYRYDKEKEIKYLEQAKQIVFQNADFNNNNISLYYGWGGVILVQLYYYYLTKDDAVLRIINSNVERVIIAVRVMPKKYFMNINFAEGVSGIMYIYTLLMYSNDSLFFKQSIVEVGKYINDHLKFRDLHSDYIRANYIYSILKKYIHRELSKTDIDALQNIFPNQNGHSDKGSFFDILKRIIYLASNNIVFINLNTNYVCRTTIQYYFPRTVDMIGTDYKYSQYFSHNALEIVIKFINSFECKNEIIENLFILEKNKFNYELELRSLPSKELIKRNNKEVRINIEALCMQDDELLQQYYKYPEDVRIVKVKHYKTLEIEEDISEAHTYLVAMKPRTTPRNELYISECCLEGVFKLINSFSKIHKPIKGEDLVKIMYQENTKIDYHIVKRFAIDLLRKFILYRLLTIIK